MPVLQYDAGIPYTPLTPENQTAPDTGAHTAYPSETTPSAYYGPVGPSSTTTSSYYYTAAPSYVPYSPAPANIVYDDANPSQQLALELCNITAQQWRTGQLGDLSRCLHNYTVDVFIKTEGAKKATWMIVRDDTFLPDTLQNLAVRRPPIPIIIGTVEDEDADYAFKLVADGQYNQSESQLYNTWMMDFAKKNKLNDSTAAQAGAKKTIHCFWILKYGYSHANDGYAAQPGGFGTVTPPSYGYSSPSSGYTTQSGAYAPQPSGYSAQNSGYASQGSGYASQSSGYASQSSAYNTQSSGYTSQSSGYSNQTYGYSNQQAGYNQGSNQYQGGGPSSQNRPQYEQNTGFGSAPSSIATNPQAVAPLKIITKLQSDSGIVSQTASEIDTFMQNGNKHVRVYQFTHITDLGRENVPDLGSWKPVYKGQDVIFLFMSETVWTSGSPTSADRRMADQMGDRWTQFAKEGWVLAWNDLHFNQYFLLEFENENSNSVDSLKYHDFRQVSGWQPSDPQIYNYCSLNYQPSIQVGYAQEARTVFNNQVYPIVQQAQMGSGVLYDQPKVRQPLSITPSVSNPMQVDYSSNGPNSSVLHISFQVKNVPGTWII
ncbi:unnamed protein product [Strongylus vulgaris]|uniref:Carboxylesterase type B domain-containing protein n=1 Tax=Strongylus vulgaris TaxID=40348 RepID=A0A3P7JI15_STRVU|nr:unnamed protein product [Strongylus vulgaris]